MSRFPRSLKAGDYFFWSGKEIDQERVWRWKTNLNNLHNFPALQCQRSPTFSQFIAKVSWSITYEVNWLTYPSLITQAVRHVALRFRRAGVLPLALWSLLLEPTCTTVKKNIKWKTKMAWYNDNWCWKVLIMVVMRIAREEILALLDIVDSDSALTTSYCWNTLSSDKAESNSELSLTLGIAGATAVRRMEI